MDFTGVAIGSGVNQYMRMDEMARQNKKLEIEKALADQQMEKGSMELDRLRQADLAGKNRKAILEAYDSGDWTNPALQSLHKSYNSNAGSLNDGLTADHVGFDKSGAPMFAYKNADGAVTATRALSRNDVLNAANNQYFDSISSPELLMQQRRLDQEDRKNYVLMAHYGRPTFMQDGTGRIIAIDQNGKQIGTYGSARPQLGGTGAQMGQLVGMTDDKSGLVYNTPNGLITRPLPAGVSGDNLFPKATGIRGTGAEGPKVKYVAQDGTELQGSQQEIYDWRMQNEPTFRAANGGGNNSLSMPDPRKPAQGTGLKTPQAKVSAEQQAKDFGQKYQGWSRQKAGNDFIVVGPNGQRMWAADFDEQNGPNSSLMLNYR